MKWLIPALLLVGCSPLSQDAAEAPICNANNWATLVGQPEAALYGALGNLRVIKPGQPITKDFNPDRLNAVIGRDGRIERFGCY